MKRKELWELLGEVPADMIEEASVPRLSLIHISEPTRRS